MVYEMRRCVTAGVFNHGTGRDRVCDGQIQQTCEADALQRVARGHPENLVAILQQRGEQCDDAQRGGTSRAARLRRRSAVEPRIARQTHQAADEDRIDVQLRPSSDTLDAP